MEKIISFLAMSLLESSHIYIFFLRRRIIRRSLVCHSSEVLVWESEHFGQQIILIEIFQVVNLIERPLVLLRHLLNFVQYFLIIDKTCPKYVEVVLILIKNRRTVHNLSVAGGVRVLHHDSRLFLEEV